MLFRTGSILEKNERMLRAIKQRATSEMDIDGNPEHDIGN